MLRAELRRRVEELLAGARPDEREAPAAPEVVALSALLLGQVRHPGVRRRVAGSTSLDEMMTWLAVDRLILLLPPEDRVRWPATNGVAAEVLEAVVGAIARCRRA